MRLNSVKKPKNFKQTGENKRKANLGAMKKKLEKNRLYVTRANKKTTQRENEDQSVNEGRNGGTYARKKKGMKHARQKKRVLPVMGGGKGLGKKKKLGKWEPHNMNLSKIGGGRGRSFQMAGVRRTREGRRRL